MNRSSKLKRSSMKPGKGFKRPTLEQSRDRLRARRGQKPARFGLGRGKSKLRAGNKPLRTKRDPALAKWSREVRERDGNRCQWPGIDLEFVSALKPGPLLKSFVSITLQFAASPCATRDARIDPHHIAEKGLRPDLKYELGNGIALCRTHHDWLPLNRKAAIAMNLLSDKTYELAQREKRAA